MFRKFGLLGRFTALCNDPRGNDHLGGEANHLRKWCSQQCGLTLTTCVGLRSLQRGGKLPLRSKLGIKQGSHQPTILPLRSLNLTSSVGITTLRSKFQGKVRKGKVGFGSKQSTLMSTTLWDSNHIVRHIIPAEGLLLLQDRGEGVGRRYPLRSKLESKPTKIGWEATNLSWGHWLWRILCEWLHGDQKPKG